ncbi:MAG: hypothetical protein D6788_10405 [Planctomycetota bacterium]|nr:MAG: hypothetical protein D6788_10405 [Planctomycetota bacterium]
MLVTAAPLRADIHLVLHTANPLAVVGDRIRVDVLAVSDDGTDQPFLGAEAVLTWDPLALALRQDLHQSDYVWTQAGFPNDASVGGLNADCCAEPGGLCLPSTGTMCTFCDPYTGLPCNDGEAFYSAWVFCMLCTPPTATADGLLVASLEFEVLAPVGLTRIGLGDGAAGGTASRVVAGDDLGRTLTVTGALVPLDLLLVSACGERGDFDADCRVSLLDHAPFSTCLTGPDRTITDPACPAADADLDGDADLRDVQILQLAFDGF